MATITKTYTPSAYTSAGGTIYSAIQNQNNPVGKSETSTSYARISAKTKTTGSMYAFWKFTIPSADIPTNATNIKVTCNGKGGSNNNNLTSAAGLYSSASTSSLKGSTVATTGTQTKSWEITNGGTWTRAELINGVYFGATGTYSKSQNQTRYVYFYGATLTITYDIVQNYTVTSSGTGCTLSPSGSTTVTEGSSYTLNITPSYSKYTLLVKDNNIDVTSSVSNNKYIISAVNENHTIVVTCTEKTGPTLYIKKNGNWVVSENTYRKTSGNWVKLNDPSTVTHDDFYIVYLN